MIALPSASNGKFGWLRDLWERDWLKGLLLVAAVLFAYQPAWHGGFIWDDDAHVTKYRNSRSAGWAGADMVHGLTATHNIIHLGTVFFLGVTPAVGISRPEGYHLDEYPAARFFARVARQSCCKN